ncbi:Cys-tRNA(Pro)/Cys-tRNA(Cys) deacylase YbaK [compost metagenome]
MHGDCKVGTGMLAKQAGVKKISPCDARTADKHSGYQVGGTSPFGTRASMPVYMEASIAELDKIYINGGKRGFLLGLSPQEVIRVLQPVLVQAAAS